MKTLEQLRAERKLASPTVTPSPTINLNTPTSSPTPQMTEVGKQKFQVGVDKVTRPLQQGLGVVSDIVNALEYPIAGFEKGAWEEGQKIKQEKGITGHGFSTPKEAIRRIGAGIKNIPSGFKERTTLSETVPKMLGDLGVENKAVQAGAGLISSLAVPTIPFAKIAKATKLETAVPKLLSKAGELPVLNKVKKLAEEFSYEKSAPADFLRRMEAYNVGKSKAAERAAEVARPLMFTKEGRKLTELEQKQLGDAIELTKGTSRRAVTPEEIALIEKYKPVIDQTRANFNRYREELIAAGADPAIFDRWANNYFGKTVYSKFMQKSGEAVPYAKSGRPALDTGIYKKKIEYLPEELERELGKIETPAYGASLAAYASGSNVETMNLFKWIAKNYVEKGDDLVELPKVERLGILSGKRVPRKIASIINEVVPYVPKVEGGMGVLGDIGTWITKRFKEGKTVLSPKQLIRNIPSNWVAMYLNPSGRADAIRRYPQAIAALKNKATDKWYKEAKNIGLIGKTQASEVLGTFIPEELKQFKQNKNLYTKAVRMGGAVQSNVEEASKLAVFINERLDGKSVIDAAKAAEEALFDYQKVSPLVKKLRKGPIPFITYPLKAAELTAKTLYKQPKRLKNIGSMERAIQGLSEEGNEQFIPDYLRQAVRLPIKSSKTGNQMYLNAKYMYPFGNLFEGGTPLGLTPNPMAMEAISLLTDRDAYYQLQNLIEGRDPADIERISDQELAGLLPGKWRHFLETFGPTPVRSIFKAIDSATKMGVSPTEPSFGQAVAQELGLPVYQYSPAVGEKVQTYQRIKKIQDAKQALDKYMRESKPGSFGYQFGLDKKRKAWEDVIQGK